MNKSAENKNKIQAILKKIAAKRFSRNEMIVLTVTIIILLFAGNYYFNAWIKALKTQNSVVVSITPPIEPKLPAPIIIKQDKPEPIPEPIAEKKKSRDPFLSSKNPQLIQPAVTEKPVVELKLSGILWDDKIPSAIINSTVVKIGDLIEGKTVVDIEKTRVTVMEDGKIFIIELRKQ